MRQTIAYYLMLLYLTVLFKPLIPVIGDLASHYFDKAMHEINVHAKYGANHLDAEIAKTSSDNDNSKNGNTVKTENIPVHIQCVETPYSFLQGSFDRKYCSLKMHKFLSAFISNPSPPPKSV
jgi:hypothetical protein